MKPPRVKNNLLNKGQCDQKLARTKSDRSSEVPACIVGRREWVQRVPERKCWEKQPMQRFEKGSAPHPKLPYQTQFDAPRTGESKQSVPKILKPFGVKFLLPNIKA